MSAQFLKKVLMLISLVCLASCGDQTEGDIERGIESAVSDLTSGSCQRAIDTLNEIGYQKSNIRYLKTYASAYACRAGYSTPRFFDTDLPLIGNPSAFGGFTRFSTADTMDQPEEGSYRDLRTAVNALLYAGGIPLDVHPTIAERERLFNDDQLKDLHAQLFYMVMSQFGKFLHYYGNPSSLGVKGGGAGANNCLLNYDMAIGYNGNDIEFFLNNTDTGSCAPNQDGHPDMGPDGNNLNVERLCQGVVWFNNLVMLLTEVLANTAGDDFTEIEAIQTNLNDAITIFTDNTNSNVANMYSQTSCEQEYASDDDDLQIFYAVIFETLFL